MSAQQELTKPQEAGSLSREMFQAFRDAVEIFQKYSGQTRQEAVQQALEFPDSFKEQVLKGPINEVDWRGLGLLAETDPQAADAR